MSMENHSGMISTGKLLICPLENPLAVLPDRQLVANQEELGEGGDECSL
jgi:hypothetical protein